MNSHQYLADGRIVRILTALEGGRSVVELGREYDEDGDVEVFFSGTEIVDNDKIHQKPPIDAYAQEIKRLEAEQRAANEKLSELSQQITLTERRVKALAIYEPLKRIEDFLAGKLTHYVEYIDWCSDLCIPKVLPLEKAHDGEREERRWGDELRLLALFGKKDRSMQWKLNRYSDGSGGGWTVVEPFCSVDEANARAREIVAESFAKIKDEHLCHYGAKLVNSAKACGAPIPEGFAERLRKSNRSALVYMVEKTEKERAGWQAQLDALDYPKAEAAIPAAAAGVHA